MIRRWPASAIRVIAAVRRVGVTVTAAATTAKHQNG